MVEDTFDKEILRLQKEKLAELQKRKENVDKLIPRFEQEIMALEEKITNENICSRSTKLEGKDHTQS